MKNLEEKIKVTELQLKERLKELNCLYELSKVIENIDISIEKLINETILLIPPGLKFPEITSARITYNNIEYKTKNFRESNWKISTSEMIETKKLSIEVFYSENKSFFKEERDLIKEIGKRIKRFIRHKEAELILKKQNDFLIKIIDSLTHPFYVINTNNYKVEIANSATKSGFGKLDETTTCYHLTHKREKPCEDNHACPLRIIMEKKEPTTVEHKHYDKNGKPRFYEVHGFPIFDESGNVKQLIEYTLDITERKVAEEKLKIALEESENRRKEISALLESSHAILVYRDFQDSARAIFNSCKSLIGATAGYIALMSADGQTNEVLFLDSGGEPCLVDTSLPMPIRGLRAEAYKTGKVVCDNNFMKSEWMKYIPEGHSPLRNVMFAPLILDNKTIGIMGLANKQNGFTAHDMNLASAFTELASIALNNSRMWDSLEESKKRIKESYDIAEFYKDLFAHDINNILQNIQSSASLIMQFKDDKLHEEQEEKLMNIIKEQVVRGAKLVKNIRMLSNIEGKKIVLDQVELIKAINEAIKFLNKSYSNRNLKIDTQIEFAEIFVGANEFLVEIFENILINAVRYNRNSNIEITIKINKIVQDGKHYIKIEFIDNGIGISNDRKELIFEDVLSKEKKSLGLGIGLSLVKKILNLYDGKIRVEDKVPGNSSQGSNFIILIPEMIQI